MKTSLGDWSSTQHWRPTLKTWQFADATVCPFPPVPNLFTWVRLARIHPAAGVGQPLTCWNACELMQPLPFTSPFKSKKVKAFFSKGKAVLPSQFSQLNTSQGASSAIRGLDVIPWAWWIALKWRQGETYQLSRYTLDQHGWTTPPSVPPSGEGAGAQPVQGEGFDDRRDAWAQQTWARAQPHEGHTSPRCEPAFAMSKIIYRYMASLDNSFSILFFWHLISDFFIPTASS